MPEPVTNNQDPEQIQPPVAQDAEVGLPAPINASQALGPLQAQSPAIPELPTIKPLDPAETVEGRIQQISTKRSPLQQLAQTRAAQNAQSRGVLSSTMAIEAGEKALYEAALPIAATDAELAFKQKELENQRNIAQAQIETDFAGFQVQKDITQSQILASFEELRYSTAADRQNILDKIASDEGIARAQIEADNSRLDKEIKAAMDRLKFSAGQDRENLLLEIQSKKDLQADNNRFLERLEGIKIEADNQRLQKEIDAAMDRLEFSAGQDRENLLLEIQSKKDLQVDNNKFLLDLEITRLNNSNAQLNKELSNRLEIAQKEIDAAKENLVTKIGADRDIAELEIKAKEELLKLDQEFQSTLQERSEIHQENLVRLQEELRRQGIEEDKILEIQKDYTSDIVDINSKFDSDRVVIQNSPDELYGGSSGKQEALKQLEVERKAALERLTSTYQARPEWDSSWELVSPPTGGGAASEPVISDATISEILSQVKPSQQAFVQESFNKYSGLPTAGNIQPTANYSETLEPVAAGTSGVNVPMIKGGNFENMAATLYKLEQGGENLNYAEIVKFMEDVKALQNSISSSDGTYGKRTDNQYEEPFTLTSFRTSAYLSKIGAVHRQAMYQRLGLNQDGYIPEGQRNGSYSLASSFNKVLTLAQGILEQKYA